MFNVELCDVLQLKFLFNELKLNNAFSERSYNVS